MRHLIFACFILAFSACGNDEQTASEAVKVTEESVDNVENSQIVEAVKTTANEVEAAATEVTKEGAEQTEEAVNALTEKATEPQKVVKQEEPKKEKNAQKFLLRKKVGTLEISEMVT